jgi:hypothetical protein
MLRRISCCLGFTAVLCCLMGGNSITHTCTPNPGGKANRIDGSGIYVVDKTQGFTFGKLVYYAEEGTTKQLNQIHAKLGNNGANTTWDATLGVVPGTYEIYPILTVIDRMGVAEDTFANPASVKKIVK